MGLVRTPPEERDQAAIDASCKECDALFALLDAELAKVKKLVLWRRVWCGRYRYRTVHLQFV